MEEIEMVDSKFVEPLAVQEAFEVALGMTFGKVQVWGSVYREWGMVVATQIHMNFPSNFVSNVDLQRVDYSYFATNSIVDNYLIVSMDQEAYPVLVAGKVSFVRLDIQVRQTHFIQLLVLAMKDNHRSHDFQYMHHTHWLHLVGYYYRMFIFTT